MARRQGHAKREYQAMRAGTEGGNASVPASAAEPFPAYFLCMEFSCATRSSRTRFCTERHNSHLLTLRYQHFAHSLSFCSNVMVMYSSVSVSIRHRSTGTETQRQRQRQRQRQSKRQWERQRQKKRHRDLKSGDMRKYTTQIKFAGRGSHKSYMDSSGATQ